MNMYEFTFLLEDSKALKPLEEVLTSFKGKKINEQPWGKRLFAYPIAKHTSAEYYTWNIQIASDKLDEFKKKLNYDNILIRYLILTVDERPKKGEKRAANAAKKAAESTEEKAE